MSIGAIVGDTAHHQWEVYPHIRTVECPVFDDAQWAIAHPWMRGVRSGDVTQEIAFGTRAREGAVGERQAGVALRVVWKPVTETTRAITVRRAGHAIGTTAATARRTTIPRQPRGGVMVDLAETVETRAAAVTVDLPKSIAQRGHAERRIHRRTENHWGELDGPLRDVDLAGAIGRCTGKIDLPLRVERGRQPTEVSQLESQTTALWWGVDTPVTVIMIDACIASQWPIRTAFLAN